MLGLQVGNIQWLREIPSCRHTSVTKGVMHCYYGDESFTYAYHNIIFVNIINNCFSFGFMESVKNCFGSKMRMTKQDRYKSNDAEMQKKYMKVMDQVIFW